MINIIHHNILLISVTEIIEPSAGNGAFIQSLDNNFNCNKFYFDLIPEHDKIKQQDFLELDLEYKQGRLIYKTEFIIISIRTPTVLKRGCAKSLLYYLAIKRNKICFK